MSDYTVSISNEKGSFQTAIQTGNHALIADEPIDLGGTDQGPNPYDLLLSSLGACTAITLRMYANRKQWDLQKVEVDLKHSKDYHKDCEDCEQTSAKIDIIERVIRLHGNLDDDQIKRLMKIADKCPVHKTLTSTTVIKTQLEREA